MNVHRLHQTSLIKQICALGVGGVLALTLTSCSSNRQLAKKNHPVQKQSAAYHQESSQVEGKVQLNQQFHPKGLVVQTGATSNPEQTASSNLRMAHFSTNENQDATGSIVSANHIQDLNSNTISTVAHHLPDNQALPSGFRIEYAPPDPHQYPDEYIWDGGDRDYPVHYDEFNRQGLDTEDTIAEYTDHTGDRHVKPSNQVALYSPRFNAVRTIVSPSLDSNIDKLAATRERRRSGGIDAQLGSFTHNQRYSPTGVRIRSRASGLESEAILENQQQVASPAVHDKLINAFEDLSFISSGQFFETENAMLAKAIQSAAVWTHDQFPVIQAQTNAAGQIEARATHNQIVGIEENKSKGRLRIVKLANKKIAKPGETVSFKIRFDNLGDRELHHIKIIDNLTPRLEYIEQSATCDLKGRLDVENNGEGSLVLKFILEEPLAGHSGGVITFQAKVR